MRLYTSCYDSLISVYKKSNMKTEEIWKDVKGYEGHYEVSSLGRVKSLKRKGRLKERTLKSCVSANGYFIVGLHHNKQRKTRKTHQLVAEAFLNHIVDGHKLVVNHINFDRTDNRVENLEIVTQRQNTNLKHLKSSSQYTGVSRYKRDGKWISIIQIKGKSKYLGLFTKELDAHHAYQKELNKLLSL